MSTAPRPPDPAPRVRAISDFPALVDQAVEMLRTPAALLPLSPEEARMIVSQMALARFNDGTVVIREGDAQHADHLLLLLDGQLEVEIGAADGSDAMSLSVLNPGSIVGEMSLFDGAPRSATCTAIGTVTAAALTRRGLERLIELHPLAAARLMLGLSQRMADRLRALGDQMKLYAQMAATQQAEIAQLRSGR
jgi:CRP/FNR family transcriptional regulator, cyclic AMP receptor protein